MENSIAIIRNETDKSLSIKLNPVDINEQNLLNTIIVLMEWCQARHNVDVQKIMNAIKEKTFFNELVYNGADISNEFK